jgi:hypothetical protein
VTWGEILWFPPLMLAISVVVGAAGRRPGELGRSIRRTFVALSAGVISVGIVVRLIVHFFV